MAEKPAAARSLPRFICASPPSATASDAIASLLAPMEALQASPTPRPQAADTADQPVSAQSVLTRSGVQAWQDEAGLTEHEHTERAHAAKVILQAAVSVQDAGAPSDDLVIPGNLYLDGYTALTRLPVGLKVGGDFYCLDCTSLTHLPEGLSVGGE
ncbi:MAG: hypothetical protein EOO40_04215 [Deltaproteobacteria bacterium]|nr:MAG: hypothetical protein EOO40_04215 [Deltaproteobacteria bacterium]